MCYVTLSHNTLVAPIQAAGLCMQVIASLVISIFVSLALNSRPPPSLPLPGWCRLHYIHGAVCRR